MNHFRLDNKFEGVFENHVLGALLEKVNVQHGNQDFSLLGSELLLLCRGLRTEQEGAVARLLIDEVEFCLNGERCFGKGLRIEIPPTVSAAYLYSRSDETTVGGEESPVTMIYRQVVLGTDPVDPDTGCPGFQIAQFRYTGERHIRCEIEDSWWPNCFRIYSDPRSKEAASRIPEIVADPSSELVFLFSRMEQLSWRDLIPALLRECDKHLSQFQEKQNELHQIAVISNESMVWKELRNHVFCENLPPRIENKRFVQSVVPVNHHVDGAIHRYAFDCGQEVLSHYHDSTLYLAVKTKTKGNRNTCTGVLFGQAQSDADVYERPLRNNEARLLGKIASPGFTLELTNGELIDAGLYLAGHELKLANEIAETSCCK